MGKIIFVHDDNDLAHDKIDLVHDKIDLVHDDNDLAHDDFELSDFFLNFVRRKNDSGRR